MTITIMTGTPGSGKSLDCARLIRDTLKYKKHPVIANFEVNVDESWKGNFTYWPNNRITADNLVSFALDNDSRSRKEDSILLVIDESQLLFNSRTWADKDRLKFIEFMSQHRKYKYKIVLIAQSDIMIDKQFRALIEFEVSHRKAANYGLFGKLVNLVCLGNMFYACTYYYMQHVKIDGYWFRYSKRLASLYDSYKSFEGKDSGVPARSAAALPSTSDILGTSYNHVIMPGTVNYGQNGFQQPTQDSTIPYRAGVSANQEGGLQDGFDGKQMYQGDLPFAYPR